MTKQTEKAIKAVYDLDKKFSVDSVWETKNELVFIDEKRIGVPPVIVDKRTNKGRFARIGDPKDMRLVFETSTLVERINE